MILPYIDLSLAVAQCVLAFLLWQRAEPRVMQARGRGHSLCVLSLGFALAWSAPIAYQRGLYLTYDPIDWQRTVRDLLFLIPSWCIYRRAMHIGELYKKRVARG